MNDIHASIARIAPVMAVALSAFCILSACNQSESADAKTREAAVSAYNTGSTPPPAPPPVEAAGTPPAASGAPELVATGSQPLTAAPPAPASPAAAVAPQAKATTPAASAAPQAAPTPPPAIVRAGLPAGPGRDTVQRVCTGCHAIGMVTAKGRTPDGWSEIIGRMIGLGLEASDEDLQTVHAYLSRELPPR